MPREGVRSRNRRREIAAIADDSNAVVADFDAPDGGPQVVATGVDVAVHELFADERGECRDAFRRGPAVGCGLGMEPLERRLDDVPTPATRLRALSGDDGIKIDAD